MLAIAIAYDFVKHIDRKNETIIIIIIISRDYVTLSVKACLAHCSRPGIRQLVNPIITLFGKCWAIIRHYWKRNASLSLGPCQFHWHWLSFFLCTVQTQGWYALYSPLWSVSVLSVSQFLFSSLFSSSLDGLRGLSECYSVRLPKPILCYIFELLITQSK